MASADQEKKAAVEARNEADTTIYNTEKTLMEHKAKVPQEDQDVITADIASLKEALANDSTSSDELKEKIEKLKQSQMKIGEAMYKNADNGGGDGGSGGGEETKKAEHDSWLKVPSAFVRRGDGSAPCARLVASEAQAAPTGPRPPPRQLGSFCWTQYLASGRPRDEDVPLTTTRYEEEKKDDKK